MNSLDKVILFKISNYFREFSTEYKKVNNIDGRFPNDWYEYVDYGTTDDIIITLQQCGFEREQAQNIKSHGYLDLITPSSVATFTIKKEEILKSRDEDVVNQAKEALINVPDLFKYEVIHMAIKLNEILNLKPDEYADWTICLNNANNEGVYSFEQNKTRLMEHISWHKTAGSKTSFRSIWTKYCLQFIRLDKDSKYNEWLFLGAFEVDGIITYKSGHQIYNLKPIEKFQNFAEHLIIRYQKIQGPKQAKIQTSLIETIDVVKILEKKYIRVDRKFEGYDHVSLRLVN